MTSNYPKNVYPWHPSISEWMYLVESGEFLACKEQHELMKFIRLKLSEPGIQIKNEIIDKHIERAEKYFFELHPFQRFFCAFVTAVYKEDDSLLFDEYLFLAGRGTGKNGLLSTIGFNLPNVNDVPKYNIDIVATTEKQALTSFEEIYDVVDASKQLKKHYKARKKTITHLKTRSKIEYHTSNARSKDGLRSGAVVFDEIHEFENDDLINVFSSGLGKKPYPRTFYLTTDGYVRGGFLDEMKNTAKQILNGEIKSLSLFPFIFRLDDAEEVHDEKNWIKAIPMLKYSKTLLTRLRKEYNKALESSTKMIEFLTKRMNLPVQDAFTCVADWDTILATEQEYPELQGRECVGGVDFAEIRDFAAVGLLFRDAEKRYWIHHSFICKKTLKLTKFKFDIDRAVKEGFATIIDDELIRPGVIADWFVEMNAKYRITNVAGDDFRIKALKDAFHEKGVPLQFVRSGPVTDSRIAPLIDMLFATKNLVYGKDFMMRWYTNNVYVEFDNKGNKTYKKIEGKTRKTDGFHAMKHALVIEPDYKPPVQINTKFKTYTY